jgi:hypothetical protein
MGEGKTLTDDTGNGCPDLVAHVGEELRLHLARGLIGWLALSWLRRCRSSTRLLSYLSGNALRQ